LPRPSARGRSLKDTPLNQNTRNYAAPEQAPAVALAATATITAPIQPAAAGEGSSWEPWILAPLIFIFLGFDNGQVRRYFIGLVPNRYFELSLTLLDQLDNRSADLNFRLVITKRTSGQAQRASP